MGPDDEQLGTVHTPPADFSTELVELSNNLSMARIAQGNSMRCFLLLLFYV